MRANTKCLMMMVMAQTLAAAVLAQDDPTFQLSLTPSYARHPPTQRIAGLSLGIWNENPHNGVAIGFLNGSTGESGGVSLGLVNYAQNYTGLHASLANLTSGDFTGWQGGLAFGLPISLVNYVGGALRGLQSGVVNMSGRMTGVQFGLVNYAQHVDSGLQIGLVNVIAQNRGWFARWPEEVAPAMILANWRF